MSGFPCAFAEAKEVLGASKIRRLGRLLTMSLLAAKKALPEEPAAALKEASGVYVGTGLGSLGDTEVFLENIIRMEERLPKPANFTYSVHNAVASRIALEFGFQGENLTVTHRETSFETALWHALHGLDGGRTRAALVGGADELNYFQVVAGAKKGRWRSGGGPLRPLSGDADIRGLLPGEGAAFCLLCREEEAGADDSYGKVLAAGFGRYRRSARSYLDVGSAGDFLDGMLRRAGIDSQGIDLLLSGANGDSALDSVYRSVADELSRRSGASIPHGSFKQLCGEHHAAPAFGFSLAALILKTGRVPAGLIPGRAEAARGGDLKIIMLYNISRSGTHSACVVGRP